MQISNIRKNKNENIGFSLVELIIVIAGIAALGSFAVPGLLNSIKLTTFHSIEYQIMTCIFTITWTNITMITTKFNFNTI